jgi:hypothetical protein
MNTRHPNLLEARVRSAIFPKQGTEERPLFVYRHEVNSVYHVIGKSRSDELEHASRLFWGIVAATDSIKDTEKFDPRS